MKNNNLLVRKDMDVNEHERLSNCTHKTQTKERNRDCIAVLHFSHCRVFNNEHKSYPKMSVKRALTCR